jgi:hypothetical protein
VAAEDTGGADVIALDEEKLDDHFAVEGELGGGGLDGHSFLYRGGAGRQEVVASG